MFETVGMELCIDAFKEFVKSDPEAAASARFSGGDAGGAGAGGAGARGAGVGGAVAGGGGPGDNSGASADGTEGRDVAAGDTGEKDAGAGGPGADGDGAGGANTGRDGAGDSCDSATALIRRFMDKFRIQYFLKRGHMPPPYYDDADENATDLINRSLMAKMMKRAVKNGN